MGLTRRQAMAGCGGGLASLIVPRAFAQSAYPSRNIKMIVPYPAGGTTDFLGRLVAEQLRSGLGATVIVENKPGQARRSVRSRWQRRSPTATRS
jgi:tripartite-type tricarboxylate transporter receptor subunit TctC